jgi:PadR family transcriptional regulator PadR
MFRSQLVKGTTPLLILSVLRDAELYGYEIAQRIRERSGAQLAPSEGTLYPALHALEQRGALEAVWRESDRGPRRRYYRLTERGRGLLAQHEKEWSNFAGSVGQVVLRGATDA